MALTIEQKLEMLNRFRRVIQDLTASPEQETSRIQRWARIAFASLTADPTASDVDSAIGANNVVVSSNLNAVSFSSPNTNALATAIIAASTFQTQIELIAKALSDAIGTECSLLYESMVLTLEVTPHYTPVSAITFDIAPATLKTLLFTTPVATFDTGSITIHGIKNYWDTQFQNNSEESGHLSSLIDLLDEMLWQ